MKNVTIVLPMVILAPSWRMWGVLDLVRRVLFTVLLLLELVFMSDKRIIE